MGRRGKKKRFGVGRDKIWVVGKWKTIWDLEWGDDLSSDEGEAWNGFLGREQ